MSILVPNQRNGQKNVHKNVVFYQCTMFRHYCAIFSKFLHEALKLDKMLRGIFLRFMYIKFRMSVHFVGLWVIYIYSAIHNSNIMLHRIILPVSIKHVKIYNLVKLLLSLYTVVVPFDLYKC